MTPHQQCPEETLPRREPGADLTQLTLRHPSPADLDVAERKAKVENAWPSIETMEHVLRAVRAGAPQPP